MTYRLTGIVIRRRPLREADRLYTIYTRERGKVELLAQGTRKIQSKLAGTLETLSVLNIQAARGKAMDRLTTADVVESFSGIRTAQQIAASLAIFALTDDLTRGGEQEEMLFELLGETCRSIAATDDSVSLERRLDAFLWKLLPILGYRPELRHCLRCEAQEGISGFDIHGGGILCDKCFRQASVEGKAVNLTLEALRELRSIVHNPGHPDATPVDVALAVRRLGFLFLAMHGERPWPSRNVLSAISSTSSRIISLA